MKWIWNRCRRRQDASLLAVGALGGAEKMEGEHHLAECEECRSYYAEIKALAAPLGGWEKNLSAIQTTPTAQRRWAKAVQECDSPRLPLLQNIWRIVWGELLWPSRYAWAGMAALWLAILVINGQLSDPRTKDASSGLVSSPAMIPDWVEQNRVLAELAQPAFGVPVPPPYVPRPRSQKEQNWVVI